MEGLGVRVEQAERSGLRIAKGTAKKALPGRACARNGCALTGWLGACYSESPELAPHRMVILKNCGR
jgi:hypothetical protein